MAREPQPIDHRTAFERWIENLEWWVRQPADNYTALMIALLLIILHAV